MPLPLVLDDARSSLLTCISLANCTWWRTYGLADVHFTFADLGVLRIAVHTAPVCWLPGKKDESNLFVRRRPFHSQLCVDSRGRCAFGTFRFTCARWLRWWLPRSCNGVFAVSPIPVPCAVVFFAWYPICFATGLNAIIPCYFLGFRWQFMRSYAFDVLFLEILSQINRRTADAGLSVCVHRCVCLSSALFLSLWSSGLVVYGWCYGVFLSIECIGMRLLFLATIAGDISFAPSTYCSFLSRS